MTSITMHGPRCKAIKQSTRLSTAIRSSKIPVPVSNHDFHHFDCSGQFDAIASAQTLSKCSRK